MNLKTLLYTLAFVFSFTQLYAQNENDVKAYIDRFKDLAIAEQIRLGVPAAITLAQGIHESSAGKSELAIKGNNHFGIKCKSTWTGETILHDDDKKQECFRKYTSSEQSYLDHSEFLKNSNRYHFLFDLEKTDYHGWTSGLKRAGYATNPVYVQKLDDLITKYSLQQYTYEALSKTKVQVGESVPDKDPPRNLTYIEDPASYYKGIKGFWAKKGETLLPYATEKNIRYARLLALNDLPDEPLPINMFIFTEKKRRIGTEEFHIVKENETMVLISQKEAILLSSLYQFNNLVSGQEPLPGEKLTLQYHSYETPKIKQQFLKELEPTAQTQPIAVSKQEPKPIVKEESKPIVKQEPKIVVKTASPRKENWSVQLPKKEEIPQENVEVEIKKIEPEVVTEITQVPKPIIETAKEIKVEAVPVKQEIIVQEPIKEVEKPTPVATEIKSESTPTAITKVEIEPQVDPAKGAEKNKNILDVDKANRMEQLLSSNRIDGTSSAISKPIYKKDPIIEKPEIINEPVAQTIAQPLVEKEIIPEPVVIIPPPRVPERKYDETHVADSTKSLKKKWDNIVYAYHPEIKIDTTKKQIQNTKASNSTEQKAVVTPTGIKRDIKTQSTKATQKPTAKPTKNTSKKGADLKKKTTNSKTPTKKKTTTKKK
ncbi:MAG: glucosaminidase domain-containing protein [Bacteroidetes bacterium]|nr:glucosaminidase domain-containing protein [Bacteroidota bacterium]